MNFLKLWWGRLVPSLRMSFGLVLITLSVLLAADFLGLVPDESKYELEKRQQLSQSLAVMFSVSSAERNYFELRPVLKDLVARDETLFSIGYRSATGRLLFSIGDHLSHWGSDPKSASTPSHVVVPLFASGRQTGTLELAFKPLPAESWNSITDSTFVRFLLFAFISSFIAYVLFFVRTFRFIDPTAVVPDRVNSAFDTLSEGVVILDDAGQIVLCNNSFADLAGKSSEVLLGARLDEIGWRHIDEHQQRGRSFPWVRTLESGESVIGEMLMHGDAEDSKSFILNSAAILDDAGGVQGVLLTFDDVTELERQKQLLQDLVSNLELSKQDIEEKNTELEYLATRDSLTGCLNRRSYNSQFKQRFDKAVDTDSPLSCLMVDVDFFKSVNDTYGHGVGDEVIKAVAAVLKKCTRGDDIVGRYGGEEFSVILPGLEVDAALSVAERIRQEIKGPILAGKDGPEITVSIGVASMMDQPDDPADLNDKADAALYVAKQTGRDRVIAWKDKNEASVEYATSKTSVNTDRIPISDHSVFVDEIARLEGELKSLGEVAVDYSDQLEQQKNFDILTGLPGKALFVDRVSREIERVKRNHGMAAVMLVKCDLFTQVNHRFGRAVADQMFIELVGRLNKLLRSTDTLSVLENETEKEVTMSRLGGNEITVLLTDLSDREMATWVAQRILRAIHEPFVHGADAIRVNCSISVSICPEDGVTADELIANADTAMSFITGLGNGENLRFFDAGMQLTAKRQLQLESDLRTAISEGQLELYYQPKIDTQGCDIVGVEALVRWNHPERGLMQPVDFIEFAEQRGMIADIDRWVIRDACRQIREWQSAGLPTCIAVNLSALDIKQEEFSNELIALISEFEIAPEMLELEVTETAMVDNLDASLPNLTALRDAGFDIAIDDFGTGYSSLGYLKSLPVTSLKIDRAFVKDILTDPYDKEIVMSVVSMAHGLNLKVTAEGVEEVAQYELLKSMGCDEVQGYLLSKPASATVITSLLEQKRIDLYREAS